MEKKKTFWLTQYLISMNYALKNSEFYVTYILLQYKKCKTIHTSHSLGEKLNILADFNTFLSSEGMCFIKFGL